jgi:hypothetical protein
VQDSTFVKLHVLAEMAARSAFFGFSRGAHMMRLSSKIKHNPYSNRLCSKLIRTGSVNSEQKFLCQSSILKVVAKSVWAAGM